MRDNKPIAFDHEAEHERQQAVKVLPALARLHANLRAVGISDDAFITAMVNYSICAALSKNSAECVAAFLRSHADEVEARGDGVAGHA